MVYTGFPFPLFSLISLDFSNFAKRTLYSLIKLINLKKTLSFFLVLLFLPNVGQIISYVYDCF